jgi:hypothetical protein
MGPNTPALSPEAARSPGQLVARLPQAGFDDLVALAVPRGGSRPRPAAGDGPAPATRSATGGRTATIGCAPKGGRAKRSRPGTTAASRRTAKSGCVHREKDGGRGRALGRTEVDVEILDVTQDEARTPPPHHRPHRPRQLHHYLPKKQGFLRFIVQKTTPVFENSRKTPGKCGVF